MNTSWTSSSSKIGKLLAAVVVFTSFTVPRAFAQSPDALQAAAEREGALVLYIGSQSEVNNPILNAFRRKYPKIKVESLAANTNATMQRFDAENAAGRHIADVIWLTDKQSKLLHKRGLLASYKPRNIEAYPAEMHGRDYAWSVFGLTLTSFAWNTDKVKPADAPKTWNDILNPKWRGKIAMQDVLGDGGSAIWFVTMLDIMRDEPKWHAYMKQLGTQNVKFAPYLQAQEMVVSGEADLMVAAYPNFVEPVKAKGAPIEWGTPDPIIYTGLSLNIPKTAPHPNAAKLYVDFMLSEEGQDLLAKLQLLPALSAKWPAGYARLKTVKLYPQSHELEQERFEFFQKTKREVFSR